MDPEAILEKSASTMKTISIRPAKLIFTLFLLQGFLVAGSGLAAERGPVVVELFTSQACYSCPPAEAFLGELSKRTDVVALEFHVDYWNDLVYGSAGKWKDPFSSPGFTQRQRDYNLQIRNTGGVYTPQMVIDGRFEAVGSQRGNVQAAMARTKPAHQLRVAAEFAADHSLGIDITGDAGDAAAATVWLVQLIPSARTRVKSGENMGKALLSHNIVTAVTRVGDWRGEPLAIRMPPGLLPAGRSCAVVVQTPHPGPVLGAANCTPRPGS